MLDYIQRENFSEIIISTPGPIGLTALLAGKMLNLETSGIYHTDFPEYIRILTEDRFLESLAWTYMHWLYGRDTIFVNSEQYRRADRARHRARRNLRSCRAASIPDSFSPGATPVFGINSAATTAAACVFCSVGRVSKEKDLDILVQAPFRNLRRDNVPVDLSYRRPRSFPRWRSPKILPEACYTGYLNGHRTGEGLRFL